MTAGVGPQLSLRPLPRVSFSTSYILAQTAKLDDFLGPAVSVGGSGSFNRGVAGDVIVGNNGFVGIAGGSQSGYNAEAHVFGSFSWAILDTRH